MCSNNNKPVSKMTVEEIKQLDGHSPSLLEMISKVYEDAGTKKAKWKPGQALPRSSNQ